MHSQGPDIEKARPIENAFIYPERSGAAKGKVVHNQYISHFSPMQICLSIMGVHGAVIFSFTTHTFM